MLKVQRIERLNYLIALVVIAGSLITQPGRVALGLSIGAVLTCANFFVLRKLVVKWTQDASVGKTGAAPYLMLPKMVGLMGAVAIAILLLPIDAIAFVIGYSIFLVSIVIETIYSAVVPTPTADPTTEKSNTDG
ncbi:MAG: ATP synthase subunit I [Kofleriaceae bacterium]